MKVAVLGCGPTGLIAAHAAAINGEEVHIFSKARKSEMFGAQYLHMPIPGATPTDAKHIDYILYGDPDAYRRKVYGDDYNGTVSPEEYTGESEAWDIRATYDELWRMYAQYIHDVIIDPLALDEIMPDFDLVISSVPAPVLCRFHGMHAFHYKEIWALGDAPERGQSVPYDCPDNTVICNGNDSPSWYRMSKLFGYKTVEWSNVKPPFPVAAARKPLYNNCDCFPEVMRVGRFGKWTKGVLTHHAYQEVMDRCMS